MRADRPARTGVLRRLAAGAGFLGRGFGLWVTFPRLMLLGALPALIVGVAYLAGLVFLAVNLGTIADAATPFADGWAEPWRTGTRIAAGVALVTLGILFVAYTYTAVTLLVGDPFYERIWRAVENRLGDAPAERTPGFARSVLRAVADGIRLLVPAALVGVALVLCGLIPVVGQLLTVALGAVFGGWILVVELTGYAFDARGLTQRERRRILAGRRATSLGFGLATYLLFLIPLAAVVVMPAAVAGAALLSRDALQGRDAVPAKPR